MDGNSTHLQYLIRCIAKTTSPILEVGSGEYSTPVCHELSLLSGRPLLTIEADPLWYSRAVEWISPLHDVRQIIPMDWQGGFALVDCAPAESRAGIVDFLRNRATVVLAHDTEPNNQPYYKGLTRTLETYKYHHDLLHYTGIWCTVASETVDVKTWWAE